MSANECPFEREVVAATRSGEWSRQLRVHASGCAECDDAARVAVWMGNVAIRLARTQTLPDPTYLWLRAEIERRREEANSVSKSRVTRLALLGLLIGLLSAAAVLAVLPVVSATTSGALNWVLSAFEGVRPDYVALIGTAWLGLPLLLAMTYLLVLRSPR